MPLPLPLSLPAPAPAPVPAMIDGMVEDGAAAIDGFGFFMMSYHWSKSTSLNSEFCVPVELKKRREK
jgi:hypothetical protein